MQQTLKDLYLFTSNYDVSFTKPSVNNIGLACM